MCEICKRIEWIKKGENPYFVTELETGYVVIGDHQHFKGYCLFLCKEHEVDLHRLPLAFRTRFLEEMAIVGEAAYHAFGAEKINYELLGNGQNSQHLHWHIFPRRTGDLSKPGPVWMLPADEMYADSNRPSDNELEEMKRQLREKINESRNYIVKGNEN